MTNNRGYDEDTASVRSTRISVGRGLARPKAFGRVGIRTSSFRREAAGSYLFLQPQLSLSEIGCPNRSKTEESDDRTLSKYPEEF